MTLQYLTPGANQPSWAGQLPGAPEPYVLPRGEGERSIAFDTLTTVLLSGAETAGQFGMFTVEQPAGPRIPTHSHAAVHETFFVLEGSLTVYLQHPDGRQEKQRLEVGDFAYVPAGVIHSYETHGERNKTIGACSAGVERFFQAMGVLTDHRGIPTQPYIPSEEQLMSAFRQHDNIPHFDHHWTV